MDANTQEDLCTEAKLMVAINRKGQVCSLQKSCKSGGIEPSLLSEMVQTATKLGKGMIEEMDKTLAHNEKRKKTSSILRRDDNAYAGFLNY